jgi:AmmeMemoRadiSam system protein B
VRLPTVAGQFYAGTKQGLLDQIKGCYTHRLGPGRVPSAKRDGKRLIKGAVVPHAGYEFSGPVAAHTYSAIAEDGFPETFIVIGLDHQHFGTGVAITTETFRTPLGDVPVDKELARKLCRGIIKDDSVAHSAEHSIEVQLPFLQHLKSEIKFVPICMTLQDIETVREVGDIISKSIKGDDVVILASTDFTHAGPNYFQIPPAGMRVDEFASKQDEMAIKAILELDAKELIETVEKQNVTMCGYGCVASMIFALKDIAKSAELLKYATSYEIWPSTSAVGYGAIVVR